jgi:hypothetical protein
LTEPTEIGRFLQVIGRCPEFPDVNFDGYAELEIFSHDGGAGPNYGNNYYKGVVG